MKLTAAHTYRQTMHIHTQEEALKLDRRRTLRYGPPVNANGEHAESLHYAGVHRRNGYKTACRCVLAIAKMERLNP